MNYIPNPQDLNSVELPDDILNLVEALAENAHDVWAKARMDDGWVFGIQRNDNEKTHPCLIPYSELPESEKEYDRAAAVYTLKLISKMGYKIKK